MSKRYVLLQYDTESETRVAFSLEGAQLRRVAVPPNVHAWQILGQESNLSRSIWPRSERVSAEGLEYLRLLAIQSALEVVREGEVSQGRVQDEIDKLTRDVKMTPAELAGLSLAPSAREIAALVPEASEDPEACDRDCDVPRSPLAPFTGGALLK